jgi:hypothetical protein
MYLRDQQNKHHFSIRINNFEFIRRTRVLISSYFTRMGNPAAGLYPLPTIRIWEVTVTGQILTIVDQPMIEVGDGFYKYEFGTFDPTKNYACRTDGGYSLLPNERFSVSSFGNEQVAGAAPSVQDIVTGVWDAQSSSHNVSGSFGEKINQTNAVAQQTAIDAHTALLQINSIQALLDVVRKYDSNRTKIDAGTRTLTVYDDDGITPLKVFGLFDSHGQSSVAEIYERVPQ